VYQPVQRPPLEVGGHCRIQGKGGIHTISEVRNRRGRIGIRVGCSERWFSELHARLVPAASIEEGALCTPACNQLT
jgi:hypothetical protein